MKPAFGGLHCYGAPSTAALQRRSGNCDLVARTRRYRGQEFKKRLCAISSRGRNQIATKPSQRFGTHTVECPRGGDERKYASAEERAAKNQKTTVRHFWLYGESIRTSVHGSHIVIVEAPSYIERHRGN